MASDPSDSSGSLPVRIARWGGGLLGGLLVLVLAAALILPQLFTSEELKGYVVPPMEEATGRQVQIDEIGLRVLWTPAVSVSGFQLADREGYGPEPAVSDLMTSPRVALDVKTGAMDLATLAAFAPPEQVKGLNPKGTLALDLTATGPVSASEKLTMNGGTPLTEGFLPVVDALTAEGTSLVVDGGLSPEVTLTKQMLGRLGLKLPALTGFKKLGGPFAIRNGAFQVDDWALTGPDTDARLSGTLGLKGSVDLKMNMEVPLSTLQNSKIPGMAGGSGLTKLVQKLAGGKQGSETVPVKLGIGGTMTNPRVDVVDQDALKSSLQKMVKKRAWSACGICSIDEIGEVYPRCRMCSALRGYHT